MHLLGDSSYSLAIVEQHVEAMGLRYRKHGASIFVNTGMLLVSPHSEKFELSIQCDPMLASWAFAETANMTVEEDGSFSIDNAQLCPLYGEYATCCATGNPRTYSNTSMHGWTGQGRQSDSTIVSR